MKKTDSKYGVENCDVRIKIKSIKINENWKKWEREWSQKNCQKVEKILSVRMLGFFLWERLWCENWKVKKMFVIEN